MKRSKATFVGAGVVVALLASSLIATAANHRSMHHHSATHARKTLSKLAFRQDMRKLWEDHTTWTRLYIVSAIAELPDLDATATRLLANQDDIGNAIKPFYGDAAGDQLTGLLKEHIGIAGDILTAAKAADSDGVAEGRQRWDDNAVAIATFLSKANPNNWPKKEMVAMMRDHLELTLGEAVARLNSDWDADLAAYDQIVIQGLHMSDMLAKGIIRQFPDRF